MAFAALFDPLFCPEQHLDLYQEELGVEEVWPPEHRPAVLDDELPALFEAFRGKELPVAAAGGDDGYGGAAGREAAAGWASRAAARLGFSPLTAALAVAYLDRCFLLRGCNGNGSGGLRLGGEPWMARLAAVACVALAAKVEETRVPLLVDLQLCAAAAAGAGEGEDEGVFDAATVRRMELLVLSAMQWRMHPVTPFSYLEPVLASADARRQQCESVLLAVMPDWRWPRHRPSSWAAAALLATASSGDDDDSELLALINAAEDDVAECAKIISEATGMCFLTADIAGIGNNNKRKHAYSPPPSPSGVIGAFSCDSSSSSVDSRAPLAVSAVTSQAQEPPGRPPKRAAKLPPDEESRDAWPPSTCVA
ncbi:hypothetical protein PR202_gb29294 [Eleusine coracana subsp. coracana]|uniref:Cyclin-like domain-containing protein n=1 Tax=Eleusine coracana subsp. coracana TaxID=191504 RepID=A0AAV5FWP8_ELECO|nr:hypothetical protein QOZ80_6BG0475520 [Eleusine coracana subsp. coracana]GJN40124.1 hypothetical protein PR202_gb29294 [Eleusine coracana subsp. coracana]